MPSMPLPKTECLPSSQGAASSVMKNWLPFVLGPALAIERMRGVVLEFGDDFIGETEPGPPVPFARGIAALNDEIGDDAVEREAVIERLAFCRVESFPSARPTKFPDPSSAPSPNSREMTMSPLPVFIVAYMPSGRVT